MVKIILILKLLCPFNLLYFAVQNMQKILSIKIILKVSRKESFSYKFVLKSFLFIGKLPILLVKNYLNLMLQTKLLVFWWIISLISVEGSVFKESSKYIKSNWNEKKILILILEDIFKKKIILMTTDLLLINFIHFFLIFFLENYFLKIFSK